MPSPGQPGQQSLNNFYQSVKFSHPAVAKAMEYDVSIVALYSISADRSPGQESVNRLRQEAFDLPEIHRRVLESALTELGYS